MHNVASKPQYQNYQNRIFGWNHRFSRYTSAKPLYTLTAPVNFNVTFNVTEIAADRCKKMGYAAARITAPANRPRPQYKPVLSPPPVI
jgi:hypothetical protein